MEEQILKLCKRLNKFTLENLEILSEIPKTELLPILSEFVDENKINKARNEYLFSKKVNFQFKNILYLKHTLQ